MNALLNTLACGDSLEILGGIDEPFADLVFADPPFNIGYPYDRYHDRVKKNNYIAWTRDWMAACKKVLKLRVRMDSKRDYLPAQVLAGSRDMA